jgi:hypothetical protein
MTNGYAKTEANITLIIIVLVILLVFVGSTGIANPLLAVKSTGTAKSSSSDTTSHKKASSNGPVTLTALNTGSSVLDKEINKFYSCISKTRQDPPTIEKVDNCYYQAMGGAGSSSGANTGSNYGVAGPSTSPTSTSTFTSQHHNE